MSDVRESLFPDGAQCEARVSEPPHYFHSHQCERKAKALMEGKNLCTQHAKLAEKRGIRYVE